MKKKKTKYPRRKRMKQPGRLESAKHWIKTYEGKNIVKGYSNWYGVSMLCAVRELKMIGIETDEEYIKKLKIAEENTIKRNREKRQEKELLKRIEETELLIENEYNDEIITSCLFDGDENIDLKVLRKVCLKCNCCDSQDLPF